jgi:hypothetical protein
MSSRVGTCSRDTVHLSSGAVHLAAWHCSCGTIHLTAGSLPVRSPCRTTPRLLPSVLGSRPSLRRPRTPRNRPLLRIVTSRPPATSSRRSPMPPPWSRRLQLPINACHLHHRLPQPRPHSSSPPPLRPTKTRSSPDFTFRRLQCSTSASW